MRLGRLSFFPMKKIISFFLGLLCAAFVSAQNYNPVAAPAAIVVSSKARFTVLTPGVIRLEWAPDGKFIDDASLTFVNRKLPVPAFTKEITGDTLVLKTEKLTLNYRSSDAPFSEANLSIAVSADGKTVTWKPGQTNTGNLLGTTRTLDQADGTIINKNHGKEKVPLQLEDGLISRDGWVLIDDSQRPLFDHSDWPWVMPRPPKAQQQDWYFFGYGNDYKKALADYTQVAGHIALPPKFAFGSWWSRYWEYSDKELRELVGEFETHQVPLDVFVIDMDWHLVDKKEWFTQEGTLRHDQANQVIGWTGYTWNKLYFPNPDRFIQWTNEKKLMTCLNIHPASGVQPHEEKYPEMAEAMGVDPATKQYIPFDITDKKFATNYLNIVLHPLERAGIDFWWLDWQQWGETKIEGVNPTFYLNYVHYSDMERENRVRPLIFHRWGGLGNHRYQIGFSGDTIITWASLAYQPYFTMTAANVGFGYWSHDIGGHFGGIRDPELYTRWIQWGAFSPIMRTHSTKDPTIERRIWAYPLENFKAMREAYLLRYSLIPYIYTQAHQSYETGVSLCHPLYYDYPKEENAYAFKNQYLFGNDLLVSPVTEPTPSDQLFVSQKIWLPEGQWYELATGTILEGNREVKRPYTLDEVPVFVRSGAIVPMQPPMQRVDEKKLNPLILSVYPGNAGAGELYEDEGNNNHFKQGAFAKTTFHFEKNGRVLKLTINPVKGSFPGMARERGYELRFPCSFPAKLVRVNGKELPYSETAAANAWIYDGDDLATTVSIGELSVRKKIVVEIEFTSDDIAALSGKKGQFRDLLKAVKVCSNVRLNKFTFHFHELIRLSQSGQALTYAPASIEEELKAFSLKYPEALQVLEQAAAENPEYQRIVELLKARSL